MKNTRYILLFVLLTTIVSHLQAANRFWVAASAGNWNNTANWSATSGGAGGASVPVAGDVVTFDNGGLGDCNINATVSVGSITVTAGYTGTISQGANPITTTGAGSFSGGTFTGGSADIIIGGAFTLAGTNFTSTSSNIEFRNNTAFTSGNFIHNNGSARYNNTAASISITGTSPVFYNLEIVGLGRTITISSTGDITVMNTLTISGASSTTINAGTIDVNGDINITNSATGSGGSGVININGTGTQNFTGASVAGQGVLPQLTINKSSGVLNLINNPGVANTLTYTAGTINAGTSTFYFGRATTGTYSIAGNCSLNNVIFSASAALTVTVTAGSTLTANDLTIAGTGNIILNTGNINVNGNMVLTNTATGGGGSATINVTGSSAQSIDGSAIAINQSRLPIININKGAGTLSLSGNISFSANVTYTSGTIDPTTSTCNVVNNATITGNFSLYNLTVSGAATVSVTIATGNTLTVLNDLTLANGASNININTGTIAAQGNIIITNTGTGGGGTGTILINGAGSQNISSTGVMNQGKLPAVTINKTSGTVTLPSLITVRGNWTYTSGTIDAATNNSTVIFANTLTITGNHTLNNIGFDAAGNYTITIPAGNTLTANGSMSMSNTNSLTFTGGTINLNGDLNLTNTGTAGGGTTVIAFTGSTNQAITGTLLINQSRLPAITINKSGGTLTFPSLITVRGNWTYTSGTMDVTTNNSTVVFANTLTIAGNHTLNNIEFNGGNNYTYTLTGVTLTASGNMAISGINNVILTGGTINLNGDLNLTNTATGGGGTTVIAFVSAVNQSINSSLAVNQSNLPAVNINKTGGTLTFPALITIHGNWTYTSGTMDVTTNSSNIVFANTLNITGTHSLNNVTFEGNNNNTFTINTATGTILTVTGTLTTNGANNVTINASTAGANAIQAQGDITISNTGAGGGGTGGILINGASSQALASTSASGQGRLPYITIQKATGTLTLTGIISESRDWTYNGGTVDASSNSSTVVFGGNNLNINSAGMSFYNFTVNANTSTLTSGLTVNNNLTINGVTSILSAGSNTINVAGNWANRSTVGFTEATSTVNFNGATLQTITTTGGENFNNMTINNAAGIQLANNVVVATTLTMTQGNIDLGGNTLTLGSSVVNRGTLVRTNGTMINTGSFTRWFNTTTIPDGSITGLFPVGTATDYRPFYVSYPVSAPTTGGTISVAYNDATTNTVLSPFVTDGAFSIVLRKDLNWAVSTSGLAGGNYNLDARGTGFGAISSVNDLRLMLINSVIGTAGVNAGTTSNPQVNRTGLSLANLTNNFYIGSINASTLPIQLISFTATLADGSVRLDWETGSELNNDHFTIQRSTDAANWEDVKTIKAVGNSSTDEFYTAYDENPLTGISYYRLQQTDIDGKISYSAIRKININQTATINVYPNPATNYITVSGVTNEKINIILFSNNGQRMNVPIVNSGNKSTIYVSGVTPGIYFLQINHEGSLETRKISIIK